MILCANKSEEHVELLRLDRSGIRAAQYLAELPPQKLLEKKLHESIRLARERFVVQNKLSGDGSLLPANTSTNRRNPKNGK